MRQADVVIIGSGVSGLTCGILLQRLGHRVVIVEKNRHPGGLMWSYIRGGIPCPVGIHYLGSIDRGHVQYSLLDALGLGDAIPMAMCPEGSPMYRCLLGDRLFEIPVGIEPVRERLIETLPGERHAVDSLTEVLRTVATTLNDFSFLHSMSRLTGLGDARLSADEWLAKIGFSPAGRRILSFVVTSLGVSLDKCPTNLFLLVGASQMQSYGRPAVSGAEIVERFVSRFKEDGGEIRCSSEVVRIGVRNREVVSVETVDGALLPADVVVTTVHPRVMLDLLPPDTFSEAFRTRILNLKNTPGLVGVQLAVPSSRFPARPFSMLVDTGSGRVREGVFGQLTATPDAATTLLSIHRHSTIEEWNQWVTTTTGNRGPLYRHEKETQAAAMCREIEGILGPLESARLLDVFTPLTIRDWVNSPEGTGNGIARTTDQLLRTAMLRGIPLGHIYSAGQNAYASGILGSMEGAFLTTAQIAGTGPVLELIGRNVHE